MYWVFTLEEAEICLGEQEKHEVLPGGKVVMPQLLAIRAMLLAYAVECALKALWLRKASGNKLIQDGRYKAVPGAGQSHNLVQLAEAVGFIPTAAEAPVLRRLSKFARFAGRYPVAKGATEMAADPLTNAEVGFFSRSDFRFAESVLNKIVRQVSGKKRSPFPRRLTRQKYAARRRAAGSPGVV